MQLSKVKSENFIFDNGMSSILKRQVIKNIFNYSGCMFSTEASKMLQASCSEVCRLTSVKVDVLYHRVARYRKQMH